MEKEGRQTRAGKRRKGMEDSEKEGQRIEVNGGKEGEEKERKI